MQTLEEQKNTLSDDQIKSYYKTQSKAEKPLSPLEYAKSKPVGLVTSEQGEDLLHQTKQRADLLTPQSTALKNGQAPTEKATQTQVNQQTGEVRKIEPITLLNEVGQEVTFNNPDVNVQNIQKYLDQGYEVKSGTLPTGVNIGGQANPVQDEINKQLEEINTAKTEVEDLTNKLNNLDISNDPAFVALSTGIQNTWNDRIAEMEKANTSRIASMNQLGIRYGSKYTGGSFGSIVSEEERQGIQRVSSLEAKKQQALAQAEIAFRSQKWDEYVDLIQLAEDKYAQEVEELNSLNEIAVKRNEAIAKENKEQREADKFEMDRVDNVLENITDSVFNAMTGDAEVDMQTIQDIATQYDIDPNYLISGLTAKQGEEQKRMADIEAVQALTQQREASAEKSLRVSDKSTKINELDKVMSPNELRTIRDDYKLSTEELPVGSTMRDVQILQAKKFAEANKDEDPEKVVKAIEENTNLEKGIIGKIIAGVVEGAKRLFGDDNKKEKTEEEELAEFEATLK